MSKESGDVLILHPGDGRSYELGDLRAVFKADEAETAERYSISEWWREPGCAGVGAHSHDANDEVFYVLAGAPSILTGETWNTLSAGAFVRIPAGVMHDFRRQLRGLLLDGVVSDFFQQHDNLRCIPRVRPRLGV